MTDESTLMAGRALVERIKRGEYVIPDEGCHAAATPEKGSERHWEPAYPFSETRAHRLMGNDEGQF
jgi:hypothetical protein